MRAHAVTKASFLAISAVLAAVFLCVSVAEQHPSASAFAPKVEPIHAATHQKVSSSNAQKRSPTLLAMVAPDTSSVLLPIVDQPEIHTDQKLLADAVLRRLPSLCRDHLEHFYVLYQGATQRGLGGKTTIIIDGSAVGNEFVGLMTHECGHVIHGNLLGNLDSGPSNFKDGSDVFAKDSPAAAFFAISWVNEGKMKATAKKTDFASGYGQTNAFEDFAEFFTSYVLDRPWLEARAKTNVAIAAKLNWMETNLPLSQNVLGTGMETWNKTVPWDATKLSFAWNPETL